MWLRSQVIPLETTSLLLSIFLEISLIFQVLHLNGSEFFDLIVVNNKSFTIEGLILKPLLGVSACIWLLEAHESIGIAGVSFLHPDVFKFSIVAKDFMEFFIGPVGWEVLNIQIDSLLGALVSNSLHELLLLPLLLGKSMSHVQLQTIAHISVQQRFNGLVDALWAIHLIFAAFIIIAHESELSNLIIEQNKRFNFTKWRKNSFDILFFHVCWDVFEVDVVNQLHHYLSIIFRFKSNSSSIFSCFFGILLVFKAYKSESFLRMVGI